MAGTSTIPIFGLAGGGYISSAGEMVSPGGSLASSDNSGGASKGMDPLTAGLGFANLGASIFGGMAARRTQANIANAQMAAAADQLKNQIQMTRDMTKFQEASNIANRVFGATTGADLEFERQRKGALFEQGPLRDLKLAGDMAERKAILGLAGSEEAKAISRRENKQRLKDTLAQKQGSMMGMFGRIAPVDVDSLFV
jgi:hypothetical protein